MQTPDKKFVKPWHLAVGLGVLALVLNADSVHDFFVTDADAANLVPLDDPRFGLPPIAGLENLNSSTFEGKLAELQSYQDRAQAFLNDYSRIAPPNDPGIAKLEHAVKYYDTMHDELEKLRGSVAQLDQLKAKLPGATDFRVGRAEFNLRQAIENIKDPSGLGLAKAEAAKVTAEYKSVLDFFNQARPGTVIYTDSVTGERFWYPLAGGPDPRDATRTLPPLITFGSQSMSQLPLSTARSLYELQLALDERLTVDTPLGPLESKNGQTFITEGYPNSAKHSEFSKHYDGSALDLRSGNNVAAYIAAADKVGNSHLWYEIPGVKGNPVDDRMLAECRAGVARDLIRYGYSYEEATKLAEEHTRLVRPMSAAYPGGASGRHFHFDTLPRPPIYAPERLVASR